MTMLGTSARPAIVRVATPERAAAVYALCARQFWRVIVGVEPGEREDLTDLELLLTGGQAVSTKVERNAPCPCGSGKKHKKCCIGKLSPVEALLEMVSPPAFPESFRPHLNDDFPLADDLDALKAWLERQPWKAAELSEAFAEFMEDRRKPDDPDERDALMLRFFEWFTLERPLSMAAAAAEGLTPVAASPLAESALARSCFGGFHVLEAAEPRYRLEALRGGARYDLLDEDGGHEAGDIVFARLYPVGEHWMIPFGLAGMRPASEGRFSSEEVAAFAEVEGALDYERTYHHQD